MKKSTLMVRGLRTCIQEWGDPAKPTIVLLHGWMDCGASFDYMANYLGDEFHLVAPDLRGFGDTEHAPSYWFPDYFADLDVILDKYSPAQPCNLVGHSMGGNIVTMYAGIQPQRVDKVLILEALGMPPTEPNEAPGRYRRWLREIVTDEPSKVYPNVEVFKMSIRKGNPSLSEDVVDDLVQLWGKPHGKNGAMQLKHDHKHRYANPVRYNFDDVLAVWEQVSARVGLVMAEQSWMYQRFSESGRIEQAKDVLNIVEQDYSLVRDSAHMLHIEQPEQTAKCVRQFFA